jgi:hypothetical protein
VDAVITGIEFTTDPPFKNDGEYVYAILSARVDGADEDSTSSFFVGSADEWEIDGTTLTPSSDGQGIGASTGWGKFLDSLIENNFPETLLPEDEFNWDAIIGTRVRFTKVENEAMKGKKRKAKNGKEYAYQDTVVGQVYELPGKKGTQAQGTSKVTKGSTKKAVEADEDEDDSVEALASKFLLKVVAANKGKMAKAKVSMQLLKPENGLFKHPQREAIRKLLTSDKFLNTEDGWSYNEDKEVITVEEEAA